MKAQQELESVLTAKRKAKEIRREQSALDLRLRDLHKHLAKSATSSLVETRGPKEKQQGFKTKWTRICRLGQSVS